MHGCCHWMALHLYLHVCCKAKVKLWPVTTWHTSLGSVRLFKAFVSAVSTSSLLRFRIFASSGASCINCSPEMVAYHTTELPSWTCSQSRHSSPMVQQHSQGRLSLITATSAMMDATQQGRVVLFEFLRTPVGLSTLANT